ncbi:MAG: transglycosylase SLT domain-containing protein, partial [Planctomycetes bacterium]|nr:transglycosylase SLT domain-containing protein [Planctomycetota bacterium]
FVLAIVLIRGNARAESDPFPVYSSIQPNVDFWKKIYTEYSWDQCVIHDRRNLKIIYDVTELKNPDKPGGRKINRSRTKKAKRKYKQILAKLMRGEPPSGAEERRIADLFGPNAKSSDYRAAMKNIRCQVGQKERFRRGIIRSGAYMEEIKQIFREFGLPEDLSYLPHVESSFNPKAYSKFGAAGIWQFTRSTGRRFMTVGYTVDQRRDPILSSRSAARLLKMNYDELGSWPMAITAYNHGTEGMLRAKRTKGNYERIFKEYRSRIFKFASRNFYSEFLAAREVAKKYRDYFGALTLDAPVDVTEVALSGYASLAEIAHHLNLNIEVIRNLNLDLRGPVIRGQKYVPKGYHLRLPADSNQDWESMITELSPALFKQSQKRSRIYTVRRGDTVGEIARMQGLKVRDLIAANNLDFRATIYVNQNLRIPLPDDKPLKLAKQKNRKQREKDFVNTLIALNAVTESQSSLVLADLKGDYIEEKKVTEPVQSVPVERESKKEEPTVTVNLKSYSVKEKKGSDYLLIQQEEEEVKKEMASTLTSSEFSEAPGKATAELASAPSIKDKAKSVLQPEIDLGKVQPAAYGPKSNPEIIQANLTVERVWDQNDKSVGAIRVEVEDTLGHYAEWLGVTAWEIRRLNEFPYGRIIRLGQQIKIPFLRVSKEAFEERRFEYHKELTEDFFDNYRIEKVEVYHIQRGDNIHVGDN